MDDVSRMEVLKVFPEATVIANLVLCCSWECCWMGLSSALFPLPDERCLDLTRSYKPGGKISCAHQLHCSFWPFCIPSSYFSYWRQAQMKSRDSLLGKLCFMSVQAIWTALVLAAGSWTIWEEWLVWLKATAEVSPWYQVDTQHDNYAKEWSWRPPQAS